MYKTGDLAPKPMELVHTYQISFNELKTEKIDCMIAASGFHARCTYIAENINLERTYKLMITFDETDNINLKKENELVFEELGFLSVSSSSKSGEKIEKLINNICNNSASENLNILIDYSCMPKLWIATILDFINNNESLKQKINIFFAYTPKKFIPNVKKTVDFLGPISETTDLVQNDKDISLLTGLDNNSEFITTLIDTINPQKIYAFVPEPSFNKGYSESVMETNKSLLDKVDKDNIIKYPANNPEHINSLLTSLCLQLRLDSRIVIVPQGPKTFALTSLLLSIRYPDIKLWEIISKDIAFNREEGVASGKPIVLKTIFCSDDEDED